MLVKAFGKDKKAAYLTPDYTYGHTVTKSMQDYLKTAGWTTATNQVAPLGAPDYSSFLLNIANSGADVLLNVNWGHDAVLSTQQAKQFGIFDKMKLVVPYQTPFLAREVGGDLMAGVYAATDFWWTLEDKYPLAKMFVEAFEKKYGYKPEWGANTCYMQFALLGANAVETPAPSTRRPSSRSTRAARSSSRRSARSISVPRTISLSALSSSSAARRPPT